jgi:hypothetical protein
MPRNAVLSPRRHGVIRPEVEALAISSLMLIFSPMVHSLWSTRAGACGCLPALLDASVHLGQARNLPAAHHRWLADLGYIPMLVPPLCRA